MLEKSILGPIVLPPSTGAAYTGSAQKDVFHIT